VPFQNGAVNGAFIEFFRSLFSPREMLSIFLPQRPIFSPSCSSVPQAQQYRDGFSR
jgi:hypothetical protein